MKTGRQMKREVLRPRSIGFPPGLWKKAQERARADERSVSSYIRGLIVRDLAKADQQERRAS